MKYRKKMSRGASKRLFTRTALRTKPVNYAMPMRGGIRL
jgi:hypothetical protein